MQKKARVISRHAPPASIVSDAEPSRLGTDAVEVALPDTLGLERGGAQFDDHFVMFDDVLHVHLHHKSAEICGISDDMR
mgnify:CR=1 FL=1